MHPRLRTARLATVAALLLSEPPAVDGIALPGMPSGAPGMPGVKAGAWEYHAFTEGEARPYATR